MITASDFTKLKARVKAECARRRYAGSVASYAGTSYDYAYPAAAGTLVRYEHYTKIADPLTAIDGKTRTPRTRINQADLTEMSNALTTLEQISVSATNTGCAASCTGLCYSGCGDSCVRTCADNCQGGCTESCEDDCEDSCTGYCKGTCSLSCSTTCFDVFGVCNGTSCSGSCAGQCAGTCVGEVR